MSDRFEGGGEGGVVLRVAQSLGKVCLSQRGGGCVRREGYVRMAQNFTKVQLLNGVNGLH